MGGWNGRRSGPTERRKRGDDRVDRTQLRDGEVERGEPLRVALGCLPRLPSVAVDHAARRVTGAVLHPSLYPPGGEREGDECRPEIVTANAPAIRARVEKLWALDLGHLQRVPKSFR